MLAKHKVVGSTPITRSTLKPLGNQGLFLFTICNLEDVKFAVNDSAAQIGLHCDPRKRVNNRVHGISWRPRRDLNPCYRRERPVSWAGLDDGDGGGEPCWT